MTRKEKIQQSILSLMKDKGVSQVDIAKHYGVSRQAIFCWLKTSDVGYEKLFDIAEYVGLEVEILVRCR